MELHDYSDTTSSYVTHNYDYSAMPGPKLQFTFGNIKFGNMEFGNIQFGMFINYNVNKTE